MRWPQGSSHLPFRHVTRLRLPVLLLAGLTLAACGSEPVPDQLAPPAELPSPSVSATPSATVQAPAESSHSSDAPAVAPSAEVPTATGDDPAAAEAAEVEQFVRDYYKAANLALETGDVQNLESFSIPQCDCRSLVDFIRRNHPLGVIEGSRTEVQAVAVQNVGTELASVLVHRRTPDGQVIGENGEVLVVIDNGDGGPAVFALVRLGEEWKIAQVVEA